MRDFYRPDGYGSGVMLWNEEQPQVWDEWVKRPFYHPLGDQGWMEMWVEKADRLQDVFPGKFVSYKAHCRGGLPEGAAAVCMHGHPKPHQVADEWVQQHWLNAREVAIPEHAQELPA